MQQMLPDRNVFGFSSVTFSSDGSKIVSRYDDDDDDKTIRVWDVSTTSNCFHYGQRLMAMYSSLH
jgi:WD40 repeat protein